MVYRSLATKIARGTALAAGQLIGKKPLKKKTPRIKKLPNGGGVVPGIKEGVKLAASAYKNSRMVPPIHQIPYMLNAALKSRR